MLQQTPDLDRRIEPRIVHSGTVRLTHWINAAAVTGMVMSGWAIYDASPFLGFVIPRPLTLGGWLGGAIAWHLALMWLLAANGLAYILHGLLSGHFGRRLLPLGPREVWRDLRAGLRFALDHRLGVYNAVQRLAYIVALLLGIVLVLSGMALWKPVQFQSLALLFGGYEASRRVHFAAMSGLVGFVALHLLLVALVPRTLLPMITGRTRPPAELL